MANNSEICIKSGEFSNIEANGTTTINIYDALNAVGEIYTKDDNITDTVTVNFYVTSNDKSNDKIETKLYRKIDDIINVNIINGIENTENVENIEVKIGTKIETDIEMDITQLNIGSNIILAAESGRKEITADELVFRDSEASFKMENNLILNGNFKGGGKLYLVDKITFNITGTVEGTTIVYDSGTDNSICDSITISATGDENTETNIKSHFKTESLEEGEYYNWERYTGQEGVITWLSPNITLDNNIYISKYGSDNSIGIKALPVNSLKTAYERINERYGNNTGTDTESGKYTNYNIILLTDIEETGENIDEVTDEVTVTITTDTEDSETYNLKICNTVFEFKGNTILENIGIDTTNISNSSVEFFANGYNVKIGKNVTINSINDYYPILYGGSESTAIMTDDNEKPATKLKVSSGKYNMIFGGSKDGKITGNINLTIGGGTDVTGIDGDDTTGVFGGNRNGLVDGDITVNIDGGTFFRIYGGGKDEGASTTGDVTINYNQGTTNRLYGGGQYGKVVVGDEGDSTGNVIVNIGDPTGNSIESATIKQYLRGSGQYGSVVNTEVNLYKQISDNDGKLSIVAGGFTGNVENESKIIVHDGATLTSDIYGGGLGTLENPGLGSSANSTVIIEGNAQVNNVYGGGYIAPISGETNVYILGGTINGDVYGGGYSSTVKENTNVKIGQGALQNENVEGTYTYGDITIKGSVYGGGKSNTAGSENYDFSFISVEGDTNVDINGKKDEENQTTITIEKNIFGSGNAATIGGKGYLNISNLGESETNKIVSIQRADEVTIDNSNIRITGTTDRTNESSATNYTLNRIKDIKLKNNSILYLDYGVNLVKNLYSQDAEGKNIDIEAISEIKTDTMQNKIFLQEGKNIILKDEQNNKGTVNGMFFLGQYKLGNDTIDKGIYDGEGSEYFERASYVQEQVTSEENKFYTYEINDENELTLTFIEPITIEGQHTQWIIKGKVETVYYEKELIASKYSIQSQAIIEINELTASEGYLLINKNDVGIIEINDNNDFELLAPSDINNYSENANTQFGLTMSTGEQGWLNKYETLYKTETGTDGKLLSIIDENNSTQYIQYNSDASENKIPELIFNFVHSKNISDDKILGKVSIKLTSCYYKTDSELVNKNIIIELNLLTRMDSSTISYYEGAITPGAKFDVFPPLPTNITEKSDFSVYYSLYLEGDKAIDYKTKSDNYDIYHRLTMKEPLPEGTRIILIDKSKGTNEYYYYLVNDDTKSIYNFTEFIAMGTNTNINYEDDKSYYNNNDTLENNNDDFVLEEFIIQVSFANTDITSDYSNNIKIELISNGGTSAYSSDDEIMLQLNTELYNTNYTVHYGKEANKSLMLREDTNIDISLNETIPSQAIKLKTTYQHSIYGGNVIYDTTNFDNMEGLKITFEEERTDTTTTYWNDKIKDISIANNNNEYSPNDDGAIRIPIADMVSNVNVDLDINFSDSIKEYWKTNLDNKYNIKIQAIGSIDGISDGNIIGELVIPINFYDNQYGLQVDWKENPKNYQIIDKETGHTLNGNNQLEFSINYSGQFNNPNIKIELGRRNYGELVYDTGYTTVNLSSCFTNEEYNKSVTTNEESDLTMELKEDLTPGTYKVKFKLYDGDTYKGEVYKMIIIK